jgi:hypothetical protein
MLQAYFLSNFKFSTQINCINSNEPIQQAYDVNGDSISDIYICDRVIFGNSNLVGKNITINGTIAKFDIDSVTYNFTATDGILFNFDEDTTKPFFIGNVNNKTAAEIAIGDRSYNNHIGRAVILNNNLHNGVFTTNNVLNNETAYIKTITGNRIDDTINKISYYSLGRIITPIGDVNNDGTQDFAGSAGGNIQTIATIIYGNKNYNNSEVTSAAYMPIAQGFTINFHYPWHHMPQAIDLNGDGMNEVIIAVTRSYQSGHRITGTEEYRYPTENLGKINIFYGKNNHSFIDTFNMTSTQGFYIQTPNITKQTGVTPKYPYYIDTIKDHTNNGFGKILLGNPDAYNNTGVAQLISGRKNLSEINPQNPMKDPATIIFYGENAGDEFGSLVANIGDINNDGQDDFLICAENANNKAGACYIFYGKPSWPKEFYVKDMTDNDGFIITDTNIKSSIAGKVTPLGDINGDFSADFAISAKDGKTNYIIYGTNGKYGNNGDNNLNTASATKTINPTLSISKSAEVTKSNSLKIETATITQKLALQTNTETATNIETNIVTNTISNLKILPSHTVTKSKYNNIVKEHIVKENLINAEAAQTIAQINEYSSVARVAFVNPTTVSQGARITALTNNMACEDEANNVYEFDTASNPLAFLFNHDKLSIFEKFGNLEQAAQAAIGNTILLTICAGANFVADKFIPNKAYFPSLLIVPVLATLSANSKALSLLALEGSIPQKLLTIAPILTTISTGVTYYKFYKNFKPTANDAIDSYSFFYDSYNDVNKFFMPIELAMNSAIGVVPALVSGFGLSCTMSTHINTVIYTSYTSIIIAKRPFSDNFENIFTISLSVAQTIPFIIQSLQYLAPNIKENSFLNSIKDTLPTIIEAMLTAKTAYDLFNIAKGFFAKTDATQIIKSDNELPLLNIDASSKPTSRESSQPSEHTIIQIEHAVKTANPLIGQHNHNHDDADL